MSSVFRSRVGCIGIYRNPGNRRRVETKLVFESIGDFHFCDKFTKVSITRNAKITASFLPIIAKVGLSGTLLFPEEQG